MKQKVVFFCILVLGVSGAFASQYDDLVKLIKSGTSEEVIIAFIEASDSSYNLTSDQVLQLKTIGATSHEIITAMKHKVNAAPAATSAPLSSPQTQQTPPSPETTVVAPPPGALVYRVPPPWRPRRVVGYWYNPSLDKTTQALQLDVAGLMMGTFSLNYEYLINRQHGLVLEGSYYPGYADWDSHGENLELSYRWHWARNMNSGFIGAFVTGGRTYGYYNDALGDILGFTQTSITVGPNIGKRWVSPWGFSLVGRIGYGYTWSKFADPTPDQGTMDHLRWMNGLDSELSVGYAF